MSWVLMIFAKTMVALLDCGATFVRGTHSVLMEHVDLKLENFRSSLLPFQPSYDIMALLNKQLEYIMSAYEALGEMTKEEYEAFVEDYNTIENGDRVAVKEFQFSELFEGTVIYKEQGYGKDVVYYIKPDNFDVIVRRGSSSTAYELKYFGVHSEFATITRI